MFSAWVLEILAVGMSKQSCGAIPWAERHFIGPSNITSAHDAASVEEVMWLVGAAAVPEPGSGDQAASHGS